jgi:amphi-Trp domain-containing protein
VLTKQAKKWGVPQMEVGEKKAPQATFGTTKTIEVEREETLTRKKVISRLKAIVVELEGGSLVLGGVPVAELAESVDFEIEYSEKDGKREIEIELKW